MRYNNHVSKDGFDLKRLLTKGRKYNKKLYVVQRVFTLSGALTWNLHPSLKRVNLRLQNGAKTGL